MSNETTEASIATAVVTNQEDVPEQRETTTPRAPVAVATAGTGTAPPGETTPRTSSTDTYATRHPLRQIVKNRRIGSISPQVQDEVRQFLKDQCENPCRDIGNRNIRRNCRCLAPVLECPTIFEATAQYMIHFALLHHLEKKKLIMEWIRFSTVIEQTRASIAIQGGGIVGCSPEEMKRKFPLPTRKDLPVSQNASRILLCRSAFTGILDIGRSMWGRLTKHLEEGTIPKHHLAGKPSNHVTFDREIVISFFETLIAEEGRPARPGRHNPAPPDGKEIPCTYSKRKVYAKYCWKQGVHTKQDSQGNFTMTNRTDLPRNNDIPANKRVASWAAFLSLWQKEFPNLKIAKAPYITGGSTPGTVALTVAKAKLSVEQLKEERDAALQACEEKDVEIERLERNCEEKDVEITRLKRTIQALRRQQPPQQWVGANY